MAFRPSGPYLHDGHKLHPKLSYSLPDGMEAAMVALGLGSSEDGPADVDLSTIAWEPMTVRADAVQPAPIVHPQAAAEAKP